MEERGDRAVRLQSTCYASLCVQSGWNTNNVQDVSKGMAIRVISLCVGVLRGKKEGQGGGETYELLWLPVL